MQISLIDINYNLTFEFVGVHNIPLSCIERIYCIWYYCTRTVYRNIISQHNVWRLMMLLPHIIIQSETWLYGLKYCVHAFMEKQEKIWTPYWYPTVSSHNVLYALKTMTFDLCCHRSSKRYSHSHTYTVQTKFEGYPIYCYKEIVTHFRWAILPFWTSDILPGDVIVFAENFLYPQLYVDLHCSFTTPDIHT